MSRAPLLPLLALVVTLVIAGCQPSWPAGLQLPAPVQSALPANAPAKFMHKGHVVQPRAIYELEALVLSVAEYGFDANAEVSPLDFAVGWGPMADKAVLDELRVRQNDRYFFWSSSGPPPLDRKEIERSAANIHLVWGNKAIGKVLEDVEAGDVVKLGGALVDVTFKDGHEMKSSLSREDVGGGACEVLWVDEATIVK